MYVGACNIVQSFFLATCSIIHTSGRAEAIRHLLLHAGLASADIASLETVSRVFANLLSEMPFQAFQCNLLWMLHRAIGASTLSHTARLGDMCFAMDSLLCFGYVHLWKEPEQMEDR